DVISILGAAGVLGVAIGFASQTSLSNLISGVFLVSERSFKLGDYISVAGEEGSVESINLLSVYLRRPDNSLVRIPCETLIKSPVTNITGSPRRRIDMDLGVDYSSDLTKVKDVILDVIKQEPELLDTPAPTVMFSGFGDSSLNLHIGAWCKTEVYHGLRYRLATAILERFNKEGINIPFPVRTIVKQGNS
ncbi:MAG: mechanosensitive ion channel family protein, partial [Akkermansia sp.]|nr:mechanosensitive ion channel family protein [Akkermansia sp.]